MTGAQFFAQACQAEGVAALCCRPGNYGVRDPGALPIHLFQENIRYEKVGEAQGAHGEYMTQPEGVRPALDRAWQVAVKEPAIGEQLPGPERVLDAGSVPAGHARKDRARVHVVLPLTCERHCGTTQTVECFSGSARRGGRAEQRSSGLRGSRVSWWCSATTRVTGR